MHFLNAGGGLRGHAENVVGDAHQEVRFRAGESGSDEALFPRRFQRQHDVAALAGGGKADGEIAAAAQGLDLAFEDMFIAHVVRRRRQHRGVGGECDGGDGGPVLDEAHGKFGGDVLRVGRAAAIAEEEQLAAVGHRFGTGRHETGKILFQLLRRFMGDFHVLVEGGVEYLVCAQGMRLRVYGGGHYIATSPMTSGGQRPGSLSFSF